MSEVRVIPPIEMPEPPAPHARRKGPAGSRQMWHQGKWVSERAVNAHRALEMAGGDRERAAAALGGTREFLAGGLKVWDEAFPSARTPKPERKDTPKPRLVKPTPEAYAPKPPPPEPELTMELVEVVTVAQNVSSNADAKVSWYPSPDGELLSQQAYLHGYFIGWMAAALAAAVDTSADASGLRRRLASLALDPPDPPRLPR